MKTFRKHLKSKMKDKAFKKAYDAERPAFEEEKQLVDYGIMLKQIREERKMTQAELAKKAHVTQQQLSNIENGANATMQTYLRICEALKIAINFYQGKRKLAA